MTHSTLQLSDSLTGFIQCAVSISLATADQAKRMSVTKAQGCRVSDDRRRVTVFVSRLAAAEVLRDAANGDVLSAVFSLPGTEETFQLKGYRIAIGPLQAGDRNLLIAYRRAFAQQIAPFGLVPELAPTLFDFPDDEMLAITFEAFAVFDQTPGPRAGSPVAAP